jgi:hypothetical protein
MRRAAPALVALAAACAPVPYERTDPRAGGPLYDADAVSRLDFLGLHLGMEQGAACARLRAIGYLRQGREDCGRHGELDSDDGFILPGADGMPPPPGPGAPLESVEIVHLRYELVGGREMVIQIGAHTQSPGRPAALVRASIAAWGPPTFHGHYARDYVELYWGASREQASPANRNQFGRCTYRPQCEWQRGMDCGSVFARFATPVAHVVVYDWGRWVTIEDYGAYVRALRRSGEWQRRPWRDPQNFCPPPPPV